MIGRRWRTDASGAAVVEFAIILPVLAAVLIGGYEVSHLILTYRKLCDVTGQLADIVSQEATPTSQANIQGDMAAATQVMYPDSVTPLTLVVSEINVNGYGQAWVGWSEGWLAGTVNESVAHAVTGVPGSWTTLPSAMVNNTIATNVSGCSTTEGNTTPCYSYILVESRYSYQSAIGGSYIGFTVPVGDQVYMPPRNEATISCTDATNANVASNEAYC